jgi:predicted PurR-regulated permease PerM
MQRRVFPATLHVMIQPAPQPFYIKFSLTLVGVVAFFFILILGKPIILPLVFATLLAMLLNPLVSLLHRKGLNRMISILLVVLLAVAVFGGLVFFIVSQVGTFADMAPLLEAKLHALVDSGIAWVSDKFGVDSTKINTWLAKARAEGMSGGMTVVGQTLGAVSSVLVVLVLLPVYMFLILYYKPLFLEFIAKLFHAEKHETVNEVLTETKALVQKYLQGLMIEAAIVATLNTVGLLIIGVPYAILLGVVGALLNMIPYVGNMISMGLAILMALVAGSTTDVIWVIVLYSAVQFIDNNLIVPRIVASRVKLNALVSIVAVLVGGALWGVPGMFLAIPITAIAKVIMDRIETTKPWGFLLGDSMPSGNKPIFKIPGMPRKSKPKTT